MSAKEGPEVSIQKGRIPAEFRISGSWEVPRGKRPFIPSEGTECSRPAGLRLPDIFWERQSARAGDGRKLGGIGNREVM